MNFKKINFLFLFLFFTVASFGQTNHTISTSGNSFSPSRLIVELGDTVTFINTSGFHNANGTQETFPNNPEDFGNAVHSGWTYQHIFSIPGEYDFQCDPHAGMGMNGKITVQNTTSIKVINFKTDATIFPNPFQNEISIKECKGGKLTLFNIVGKVEINEFIKTNNYALITNHLPKGIYFYKITQSNKECFSGKIQKK